MVDFIKVSFRPLHNILEDHPKLYFEFGVHKKTGEVSETLKSKKRHRSFRFKLKAPNAHGDGSLHKYLQGSNWQDFSCSELSSTIDQFCAEFGVNADNCKLHNIEFGVNFIPPFEASLQNIAKTFVCHGSKPFTRMGNRNGKMIGVECCYEHYRIKIYSKTVQLKLRDVEVIRFEVQVTTMQWLGRHLYLNDLKKPEIHELFTQRLLKVLSECIIYDGSIADPTPSEANFLKDVRNPNYWPNLSANHRYRAREKYKKLVSAKSTMQLYETIMRIVSNKCTELMRS